MVQEKAFFSDLAVGKTTAEIIQNGVAADKIPLASVFEGLSSKLPRVKFGCSKTLLLLSAQHPKLLCSSIDRIAELLDSKNRIIKWSAITILGNLAMVDTEGRIRNRVHKLYGFLAGGELITANNAMAALGKISRAFPEEQERIAAHLLGIERQLFETDECRNIAIGKAILALGMFCDPANSSKSVLDFVGRQTGNSRRATANKAKAFIAKRAQGY